MKVVLINISDKSGGAAIAASRTASDLTAIFKYKFISLVRTKVSNDINVFETTDGVWKKVERYITLMTNVLGLQYVWLPFSKSYIIEKIEEEQPQIIWLNNTLGGFFQTSLIQRLSKKYKTVWTLHDMWAFTANGAHTFGEEGWKEMKASKGERKVYPQIILPTGNWLIRCKKKIYDDSSFTVVVPSFWLKHLAEQSPLLKGKRIVHIPHGIDLNKYRPSVKSNAKERLGIPPQAHTIAFIAQKLKNNFFKGGADLLQILQTLNTNTSHKIHVLLMGEDHMPELLELKNLIIHEMGYVKEESKMVSILNATDVFVYPTRADNFPLVLLEATACGVPSVTFNVGGCGEIVQDQSTGYVIDEFNSTLAAQKVLELLNDENHLQHMSIAARKYAEEYFSSTLNAQRYHELFQEL